MVRTRNLAALFIGTAFISLPAFSQESGLDHRSEASVQFIGTFTRQTTQNTIPQSSSDSGGVLASYRFLFSKHQGVEVNYAYSRNTVGYTFGTGSLGTDTNQNEITGAYVFRMPIKHLTPFAEAGFGGLVFNPRNNVSPAASTQTRVAFLFGAGVDFGLGKHIFVRAGYRGLVYNTPTFNLAANLGADRNTLQSEPSIGVGWKF
jgi:outer membrane immunogenic protein